MKPIEIVVDTREQNPFIFPEYLATTHSLKLDSGDYALFHNGKIDTGLSIERKSLNDFVNTVLNDWDRFMRELDRMRFMPARIVLVEATLDDVCERNYSSGIEPEFIFKKIAKLLMQGVTVQFNKDPDTCATYLLLILNERRNELNNGPY